MFRIASAVSFVVAAFLVGLGAFLAFATPTFQNVVIDIIDERTLIYLACAGLLLGTATGIASMFLDLSTGWWITFLIVGFGLAVFAGLTLADNWWLTHALGIQMAQNVFGAALALAAINVTAFGKYMERRFIHA